VRVTRGSLEGVEGILVRKKSLYRLVLSVDMLAQSVALEVDALDVEPAKGPRFPGVRREEAAAGYSKGPVNNSFGRSIGIAAQNDA
jgi:hypothetical protein